LNVHSSTFIIPNFAMTSFQIQDSDLTGFQGKVAVVTGITTPSNKLREPKY
jgi:hypothetical protein